VHSRREAPTALARRTCGGVERDARPSRVVGGGREWVSTTRGKATVCVSPTSLCPFFAPASRRAPRAGSPSAPGHRHAQPGAGARKHTRTRRDGRGLCRERGGAVRRIVASYAATLPHIHACLSPAPLPPLSHPHLLRSLAPLSESLRLCVSPCLGYGGGPWAPHRRSAWALSWTHFSPSTTASRSRTRSP